MIWLPQLRPQPEPERPIWMVTFGDLLALLLAFFVLLFSMSSLNSESWRAIVDSLARRLNPGDPATRPLELAERAVDRVDEVRAMDLDYLRTVLERRLREESLVGGADLRRLDDRLVVSLPADALFAPGEAGLSAPAAALAERLGGALRFIGNRIEVAGHSDPRPVGAGSRFASNWELSLARAVAFATALGDGGYGFEISAYGHAEGRYYDVSPELPTLQREQLARRVDLVFHRRAAWSRIDE